MLIVHLVFMFLMSVFSGVGISYLGYIVCKESTAALYISVPVAVIVCGTFGGLYMDVLIMAGVF